MHTHNPPLNLPLVSGSENAEDPSRSPYEAAGMLLARAKVKKTCAFIPVQGDGAGLNLCSSHSCGLVSSAFMTRRLSVKYELDELVIREIITADKTNRLHPGLTGNASLSPSCDSSHCPVKFQGHQDTN